jgi:Tfp pilus assembly protein PilF
VERALRDLTGAAEEKGMGLPGSGEWVDYLSRSLGSHERERGEVRATLPRYEIVEEIKRGGMGVVYRAWDPHLGREVALKVLLEDSDAEARRRFLREAQLAAQLHHPNIVPVYDTGECMGQVYLAMLLIEGTTLDKAGLDLKGSLAAMRDVAGAIDYAHQRGVVHRDIKPSNLMIDRGSRVYVTDFGLARKTEAAAGLTLPGAILGTPAYMAPEQAQGLVADARSDVYSLGATLYELVTGRAPFAAGDPVLILQYVAWTDPPPLRSHRRDLPRDVETIVAKAMERDPSRRYASARAMAEDLGRFLDGEPILARPPGIAYRVRRFLGRHRWLLPASSVAGAAALAFWLLAPAADPELERLDGHIGRREIGQARELLEKIGRERPHDRRAQSRAEALRGVEEEELQRHLDFLGRHLALGDAALASDQREKMRRLAPDHPKTRRASALLEEFGTARETLAGLLKSAEERLKEGDRKGAWEGVRQAGRLRVEGLESLGLPGGLAGAREAAMDLQRRLSRVLEDQVRSETASAAEVVPHSLALLKEVDEPAYAAVLKGLAPLVKLRCEAESAASARGTAAILAQMEAINAAGGLTADVTRLYGDRLKEERKALSPERNRELYWRDATAAFGEGSFGRLDLSREYFKSVRDKTEVDALDEARTWLEKFRNAKAIASADPEQGRRRRRELDEIRLHDDLRAAVVKPLSDLDRELFLLGAREIAADVRRSCETGALDAARSHLRRLENLSPPPADLLQEARGLVSALEARERDVQRAAQKLIDSLAEDRPVDAQALEKLREKAPTSEVLRDLFARLERESSFLERLRQLERAAEEGDAGRIRDALQGLTDERFQGVTDRGARVAARLLGLGRKLLQAGDAEGAAEWLGRGVDLAPGSWELLEERGMARRELGEPQTAQADWEAARASIERALPGVGRKAELLFRRARLQRRLGAHKAAVQDLRELLAVEETPEGQIARAQSSYLAGQPDEGLAALARAAELGADAARVSYWLGLCHRAKGAREQALVHLKKAAEASAALPDASYQLAVLYVDLGQWSSAVGAAGEALAKTAGFTDDEALGHFLEDPRRPRAENLKFFRRDAFYVRARGRFGLGDFKECAADASESVRLDPRFAQAVLLRGLAKHDSGLYAEAIPDLDRVIELCAGFPGKENADRAESARRLKTLCEEKRKE